MKKVIYTWISKADPISVWQAVEEDRTCRSEGSFTSLASVRREIRETFPTDQGVNIWKITMTAEKVK